MNYDAEVVVAGHICLDVIPALKDDRATKLAPGMTLESGPVTFATGGVVANTGVALHKLGVKTRLVGMIGTDLFGQAIRQILVGHDPHLGDELLVSPELATSYTIILNPPNTDRMFIHAPGANSGFRADDIDVNNLGKARIFHFGYPPLMECFYRNDGAELEALFKKVKATGITTSLDMSMPALNGPAGNVDWERILARTLPYVDIFLPSLEEMLIMLERPYFEKLMGEGGSHEILEQVPVEVLSGLGKKLLDMGVALAGLKAGSSGLYLCTAPAERLSAFGRVKLPDSAKWSSRELWSPCYSTTVVGTTGSGDTTIAGFLNALLKSLNPEEALHAACAVGASSVEAADAVSGIRPWPEIEARVAAGWPLLNVSHSKPGWGWDSTHQLWVGPSDRFGAKVLN